MTVKPTEEPVDLAYFLRRVRVVSGTEDADCQAILLGAIRSVEQECGRDRLLQSTWEYRIPYFYSGCIQLPLPQVSSISHIKYTDSDGVLQTVSGTDYQLVGDYSTATDDQKAAVLGRPWVVLKYSKQWPTATLETGLPVVITFVAGWADADFVPEDLKLAICLQGGHFYRNREAVTVGRDQINSNALARGVEALIGPYKVWRV